MSNTILNIRFGVWHFQIIRPSDWGHRFPIRIARNAWQADRRDADPDWRWFEWH